MEIEKNFISKMKMKDDKLSMTMKCGVAFHHAGLDLQKRKLVEDAYKSRKIKILLSTYHPNCRSKFTSIISNFRLAFILERY